MLPKSASPLMQCPILNYVIIVYYYIAQFNENLGDD